MADRDLQPSAAEKLRELGFREDLARVVEIPDGDARTEATLNVMEDLARASAQDPAFVLWVRNRILKDVPARDFVGELRALFDYVRANVTYRHDPEVMEWVQSPHWTLFVDGQGDCDDMATLLAALALSSGKGVAFRVTKADAADPSKYSHVWAVLGYRDENGEHWFAADPTTPEPFGWEPPVLGTFPVADYVIASP